MNFNLTDSIESTDKPFNDISEYWTFSENLERLIKNHEKIVISIDNKWGAGKTTFIKQFKLWMEKRTPEAKIIYFDAFEHDYFDDPFLAVAGEIAELLPDEQKNSFCKKVAKASIKGVGKFLCSTAKTIAKNKTGVDVDEILDTAKESLQETEDAMTAQIEKHLKDYAKNKTLPGDIRDILAQSAKKFKEESGFPLIFIVDELDRCRPDFGLKLLESIKHFFSVPNVTFILSVHKKQLENMIAYAYGQAEDAHLYLNKFINISLSLPKLGTDSLNIIHRMILQKTMIQVFKENPVFIDFTDYFKPSFRELQQIANYASMCRFTSPSDDKSSAMQIAEFFLVFLKVMRPAEYKNGCGENADKYSFRLKAIPGYGKIFIKHNGAGLIDSSEIKKQLDSLHGIIEPPPDN